jgi:two-component system, NtrC family, sensor kinase
MKEQIRILFVDDEVNVLKALRRVFMEEDYEILTAEGGEQGLEFLKSHEPVQIVVSDYRMPVMNGVDFLKAVYKSWPHTVRIVLSGYADTAAVVDSVNEGHIYKFIPKPWNDDELRVTIANAVERYTLYTDNIRLTEELKRANEELKAMNGNLSLLVEERTTELMFQNAVLQRAHHILDSLPVGVVGIDHDGLIVQMNQKASQALSRENCALLGMHYQEVFPELMRCFVEQSLRNGSHAGQCSLNGSRMVIRGQTFRVRGREAGLVLTIHDEV